MDDKIIATNLSAMKAKYGSGTSKIKTACDQLIAADKKRGLATRVINIDDAAAMQKVGGSAVTNSKDPGQNKRAIDAVFKKLRPDYLLILGSTDVIPHQDLKNPVPADGDSHAFGDIPYACEKTYSRKPEDFVGPTRVVGRLPDLIGSKDPAYLVGLLKTAANFKSRPLKHYNGYFAISAAVWEGSTRMSLDNIFGFNNNLNLSPSQGPKWTTPALSKRLHFINCHGGTVSPAFQGQKRKGKPGPTYPDAHIASHLANKIVEGTVAAVECCYGAEQYDSAMFSDGQMGISNMYLAGKAYGYFGSSTIAYGPADDNGAADLICQFFLLKVMGGASLGRAALEARQEFVQSAPNMDPMDLKTIAQFFLLGDPSIVPIQSLAPHAVNAPKSTAKSKSFDSKAIERGERRLQLHTKGAWLAKNQPVCSSTESKTPKSVADTMKKIAAEANVENPTMMSFAINQKGSPATPMAKGITATAFHVAMPDLSNQDGAVEKMALEKKAVGKKTTEKRMPENKTASSLTTGVCIVAKEVNGNIVSYRELHLKK